MSPQPRDWWQEVTTYLDQALEMPETERSGWLQTLREENPALVAQLQTLLDEHSALKQEGFLEVGAGPEFRPQVPAHQTIDAYTLLSPAGQGGMGSVWLAERNDGRFERQAAVKFLNVGLVGRGVEERFKREGSILGRLAHPHIAELVDAGVSASGQPYLVLEYVDGKHIDEYCDEHKLDVQARVSLFLDVLAAVEHAHTHLIVHRDLKPSNVLVRKDGRVKLLDFGIAKLLEGEGESGAATMLTRDGGAALTPEYAAPEQITGRPVTTATDVYALGVLLYVLLTGRHPAGVNRTSPAELVKAITETEPPSMSGVVEERKAGSDLDNLSANAEKRGTTSAKLSKQLRGDLDTIVAKALKKNPEERYASVVALADDLRRTLRNEPISARPDSVGYRATKFVRRNRTTVTLAALALLALVAGVAGTLLQARTARAQRDFAYRQVSRAEVINDLNSFLLSDAAPSGKPFTVDELLGRAEHILDRQAGQGDANRAELLLSIGQQYESQEETDKARRLLDQAYAISGGVPDRSVRAKVSCALANALAIGGEIPRAESLVAQGLADLPNEPQYALDRVYCLSRASEVAREAGSAKQGIERVQSALKVLKASPFDNEFLELRVHMDLAEAYRQAGELREAISEFEQSAKSMSALGRDETQTAGTLYNNWGMALYQSGRSAEGVKILRRGVDISSADASEDGVSPMLLINYASALQDLRRMDEAANYAERGYAVAKKARHNVAVNQALLLRERIYLDLGQTDRALAMLDEVEPRLKHDLPAGHYAFASVTMERGAIADAKGDHETALRLATQAIAMNEAAIKAGGQGKPMMPMLFAKRSKFEVELGRPDEAVADARRALEMWQAIQKPGVASTILGRGYVTLGRALQAQGKVDDAHAAFGSAVENLAATLGPDHRDTRAAMQLAQASGEPQ
jgi:eukaryotic-like serine/threonine-protein kinase